MKYATMGKCLNQWRTSADDAIHRRVLVARAAARFQRRLVAKAFASMEFFASERIYQRALLLRVLGRVDNFAIHKGFSKMKAVIADARAVQLHKEKLLLEMSNGMSSAQDLEQLILLTMHQAKELVDADRATLFLIDSATSELYTYVAENSSPIRIKPGQGLIGACIQSGDILNVPDARKDRRFQSSVDRKTGYTTKEVLCVPLKDASNQIIGGLQVINRIPTASGTNETIFPFTDHEASRLTRMASQVQQGVQAILKSRREGKWKMHKFLQRWTHAKMTKTWNNWYEFVREKRRLRTMTQRCLLLWQRRASRMALNAWADFWHTRSYQRKLLIRVIARMTKQQLHFGFQAWFRHWSASNNSATEVTKKVCTALDSANQMLRLSSMEQACAVVRSAACQLLAASSATLYFVDRQRMLAWAYVANSTELHRVPFGHGIVGRMAQGNQQAAQTAQNSSLVYSPLVYNSSEEEDASVLCVGIMDSSQEVVTVLDIRRPRWSPQEASLPFTEDDEIVAVALGQAAGTLVERLQENDTISEMKGHIQQAALAEEKMASIITWLFEVIGSGDSEEHRNEIEEMRDTFIRAHYGSRQLGVVLDDEFANVVMEVEEGHSDSNNFDSYSGMSPVLDAGTNLVRGDDSQISKNEPDWSRMFAEADLDQNGSLSPAEFQAFYTNKFGR